MVARMTAPPSPHPDDALHVALTLAEHVGERQGSRGDRNILRVARVVGLPGTKLAARETLTVLDADGLPTRDGARRRTPGGVFLRLVLHIHRLSTSPISHGCAILAPLTLTMLAVRSLLC
jgi:hypothetical protein